MILQIGVDVGRAGGDMIAVVSRCVACGQVVFERVCESPCTVAEVRTWVEQAVAVEHVCGEAEA